MASDHAGSLRERRPGVWQLRVATGVDPVTGRYGSISKVHRGTEKTAKRALAALVADVERRHLGGTTETVEHLMGAWLAVLDRQQRSPTTLRTYRSYITVNIVPHLGRVPLRRLTAKHLDDFYARLAQDGRKPSTVRQHHAIVSGALRQALKWGWVASNVAELASPPAARRPRVRPPSVEQVRALIAAASGRDPSMAVLLWVAATTGARRGELSGLRWRDVDLASATLTVERAVVDLHGQAAKTLEKATKTDQERTLALDTETVWVLTDHWARMQVDRQGVTRDSFVFSQSPDCSQPYRPDRITGFFRRLRRTCALPEVNLHHLRHFSASQLVAAGVDVRTVAGRHGHADPSMTLRVYSAFLDAPDRRAAEVMGRLDLGRRQPQP